MSRPDIIINGINLSDLQEQKKSIRQGASSLISNHVAKAKNYCRQILESEDAEEIKQLAEDAYESLDTANYISDVSEVTFNLPFHEDYEQNTEAFSYMLENSENQVLKDNWKGAVGNLYSLLEDMEYKSHGWHSSSC